MGQTYSIAFQTKQILCNMWSNMFYEKCFCNYHTIWDDTYFIPYSVNKLCEVKCHTQDWSWLTWLTKCCHVTHGHQRHLVNGLQRGRTAGIKYKSISRRSDNVFLMIQTKVITIKLPFLNKTHIFVIIHLPLIFELYIFSCWMIYFITWKIMVACLLI